MDMAVDIMVKSADLDSVPEDQSEGSVDAGLEESGEGLASRSSGLKRKKGPRKLPAKPIRPLSKPATPKPPAPLQFPNSRPPHAFIPSGSASFDSDSQEPLNRYSAPEPVPLLYLEGEEEDKSLWEWLRSAAAGLADFFSVRPL